MINKIVKNNTYDVSGMNTHTIDLFAWHFMISTGQWFLREQQFHFFLYMYLTDWGEELQSSIDPFGKNAKDISTKESYTPTPPPNVVFGLKFSKSGISKMFHLKIIQLISTLLKWYAPLNVCSSKSLKQLKWNGFSWYLYSYVEHDNIVNRTSCWLTSTHLPRNLQLCFWRGGFCFGWDAFCYLRTSSGGQWHWFAGREQKGIWLYLFSISPELFASTQRNTDVKQLSAAAFIQIIYV